MERGMHCYDFVKLYPGRSVFRNKNMARKESKETLSTKALDDHLKKKKTSKYSPL